MSLKRQDVYALGILLLVSCCLLPSGEHHSSGTRIHADCHDTLVLPLPQAVVTHDDPFAEACASIKKANPRWGSTRVCLATSFLLL